jgi:serine/threonine protein kinase
MQNKTYGGKAIAAGGFGCVFRPPLKCSSRQSSRGSSTRKKHLVSKLMTSTNASEEYNELVRFLPILEQIPKYEHYFLLPETLCDPIKLTSSDLVNFDSKCKNLTRRNITKSNINTQLDKLKMIQLRDGGLDLEKFIYDGVLNIDKVEIINEEIIRLLTKAVKPMNDNGLFHLDLKAANVMINDKDKAKIIDFGLSCEVKNRKVIPEFICYRPLQYNLPFMNIVFNNECILGYKRFLKRYPVPTRDMIYDFFHDAYNNEIEPQTGSGHHDFAVTILKNYLLRLQPSYKRDPVFEYVADALYHFTTNGKFKLDKLFSHFLNIADTFGILTSYIDLAHNSGVRWESAALRDNVTNEIRSMLQDILVPSSHQDIVVSDVVSRIRRINSILGIIEKGRNKSTSIVSSNVSESSGVKYMPKTPNSARYKSNPPTKLVTIHVSNASSKKSVRRRSRSTGRTITERRSSPVKTRRRKRCPNGTRRNKKTGNCETYVR